MTLYTDYDTIVGEYKDKITLLSLVRFATDHEELKEKLREGLYLSNNTRFHLSPEDFTVENYCLLKLLELKIPEFDGVNIIEWLSEGGSKLTFKLWLEQETDKYSCVLLG